MIQQREWYDDYYLQNMSLKGEYSLEPEESIYFNLWDTIDNWLTNTEKIADYGCGVGQFAKLLIKRGKQYVYGIDFSKTAIHYARFSNPSKIHCFLCSDLFSAILTKPFDTIIMAEVLEHIEDDIKLIEKIQSGKRVIFSVPNYMYESHVRCFNNVNEVHERFNGLLLFKQHQSVVIGDNEIMVFDTIKL